MEDENKKPTAAVPFAGILTPEQIQKGGEEFLKYVNTPFLKGKSRTAETGQDKKLPWGIRPCR